MYVSSRIPTLFSSIGIIARRDAAIRRAVVWGYLRIVFRIEEVEISFERRDSVEFH